ncbi:MAG: DUF2249 domain-containing protein [Alphaproteobacteria bacterium]|nr:DUF2249 domain-containing protein [Alphaproteobacteria bacterium]
MTDINIDARTIEPHDRHRTILAAFDGLALGGALILAADHDPRPLFHQMNSLRRDELDWTYLETGPDTWRVRIGRIAKAPSERGASCCGGCG